MMYKFEIAPVVLVILFISSTVGRESYPNTEKLLAKLFDADINSLKVNKDFSLNLQSQIRPRKNTKDLAAKSLFRYLNTTLLHTLPTYRAFINLLPYYTPSLDVPEVESPAKLRAQNDFLSTIMKTRVMQVTKAYLSDKNLAPRGEKEFEDLLRHLWFGVYKRGKRINSSAFEHVFLGEVRGKRVMGFHYWLTFYLWEQKGDINYLGFVERGHRMSEKLISVGFRWNNTSTKDISTFLVGTSSEFDIAIYTTVFLTIQQKFPNRFRLGMSLKYMNTRIAIQCYRIETNVIGTCFVV